MGKKTIEENTITEGIIWKQLLIFFFPIMLGTLIQQLYTTVDTIIVGRFVGKAALASVGGPAAVLSTIVVTFFNGLANGAAVVIAQYYGAKDKGRLHTGLHTAYLFSIVVSLVISVVGAVLTPWLLKIMNTPQDMMASSTTYLRIYFMGILFTLVYNMGAAIMRAVGDSKRPLLYLVVCCVLNIGLDIFMVVILKMGIAGAALATVFSQIVSVVVIFSMLKKVLHVEKGEKPLWWPHFCKEHMQQMLHMGFPLALQAMLFPIANTIVQAGVNTMGTDQIAAWGICDKLNMLIWLLSDSMGPALTTFTAQNLGAKNKERIRKGVFVGTAMSAGAVIMVSIILFVGAAFMTPWFVSAQDAATLAPLVGAYARMMAPFFLFYAIAEALSGACCGTGDTIRPMITTLISICLLRVIGVLFILPVYETMECIVVIYIASWIAAGIAFLGLWKWNSSKL